MTVGSVRSGLIESVHPVSAVALDPDGRTIATWGDGLDREFFLRSAPKPLQAAVSQRNGAGLVPEQLAIAASSHSAFPVHVAHVEAMLRAVGLGQSNLVCPADRPSSPAADRTWARAGRSGREPIFHNCSGKHAAMLRACTAQGWSLDYAESTHPLQLEIAAAATEAAGRSVEPTGIDGCGIPTLRSDTIGLARIFVRLVNDPAYAEVASAAAAHAPLTADARRPEARLAAWLPAVVKGGAEGCIGLGMLEHGVAFAAKSWTGVSAPAVVALIALIDQVGLLSEHQRAMLDSMARPPVLGGGRPVGEMRALDE